MCMECVGKITDQVASLVREFPEVPSAYAIAREIEGIVANTVPPIGTMREEVRTHLEGLSALYWRDFGVMDRVAALWGVRMDGPLTPAQSVEATKWGHNFGLAIAHREHERTHLGCNASPSLMFDSPDFAAIHNN